jgi:hypothetical protein
VCMPAVMTVNLGLLTGLVASIIVLLFQLSYLERHALGQVSPSR